MALHGELYILHSARSSTRVNVLYARTRVQAIFAHARGYGICGFSADCIYTRIRVEVHYARNQSHNRISLNTRVDAVPALVAITN